MEFKDKLKKLRKKKNISQTELAEKIYVSRSAVAKWENGLGLPSDDSLEAIAKYFCVSKSQLIGNVETENIFVDKNKKLVKQRLSIILVVCLFIAIFVAYGIGIYFLMLRSDEIVPQPRGLKVIGNMEYKLVSDDGGYYYEVYKAKGDNNDNIYVIENEIDGVPVVSIGPYAFKQTCVQKIYFNDNLKKVEYGAFYGAPIQEIYFNEGLEIIGAQAFKYSYNLVNLEFPNSLKMFESSAFYFSSNLESLTFGENVEYIDEFAFAECVNLRKVVFNSNCEIGSNAFRSTSITRVTFSKPDIKLSEYSFKDNYILGQVEYKGTLAQWNAAVAHSDCFGIYGLYIKFIDSGEYKYTSRDYQTGMWR